jgi:hypothetical protein
LLPHPQPPPKSQTRPSDRSGAHRLPRCRSRAAVRRDLRVGRTVQPGHSVTPSKNQHLPAALTAADGATPPILRARRAGCAAPAGSRGSETTVGAENASLPWSIMRTPPAGPVACPSHARPGGKPRAITVSHRPSPSPPTGYHLPDDAADAAFHAGATSPSSLSHDLGRDLRVKATAARSLHEP